MVVVVVVEKTGMGREGESKRVMQVQEMSRCSLERLYVTPTHSSHVLCEASRLVHSPLLACRDWLTVVFPNAERNDTDTLLSFLYNCCGKHGGLAMFSAGQPRCAWPTLSKTRYSLVCLSVHSARPTPTPTPHPQRHDTVWSV